MIQSLDKQKVRQAFNRAFHYDQNAKIQTIIGQHLLKMLKQLSLQHRNVIDLGCGTGLMTQSLLETFPCDHLYAVDFSETLLTQARQRLNQANCIFICEDFEALDLKTASFDLAFSNMALHWSHHLGQLLAKINHHLSPTGYLAFSIPTVGTLQELSADVRHRFYQSEEIVTMLTQANFSITAHQSKLYQLKFDDWLTALRSIKTVGATSYHKPALYLKSKHSLLQNILPSYLKHPQLSYQIDYFIVRRSKHA